MRLSCSLLSGLTLPLLAHATVWAFPNALHDGEVSAEWVSKDYNLDGPKLSPGPANRSSFEWWHFDVVARDGNDSIAIVFFNAGPDGYKGGIGDKPLAVDLTGSFANGSSFHFNIAADDGLFIDADEDQIKAEWKGSGFSFSGTGLRSPTPVYTIKVDAPTLGAKGELTFRSRGPSHYACSANIPNASEEFSPGVGWANAVADSFVDGDLALGGTVLRFRDGVGYHDKNWGIKPFSASTSAWYWGHTGFGDFSVMWLQVTPVDREAHTTSYVSINGTIALVGCDSASQVQIVPTDIDSRGTVRGFRLRFNLQDGKVLAVNVTTDLLVLEQGKFDRLIGIATGGIEGQESHSGRIVLEATKRESPQSPPAPAQVARR